MAGIQFGNVTPSGVYGRPSIESFLAVSGAGYGIPSAERLSRAPWGNLNTPLSSGAGAGETYGQSSVPESIWLTDALAALAEVDDEIAEENLPEIDDATKKEAGRLLRALAWHPWGPTVYPMQDAEIAIHFKSPDLPDSVVILLNNGGRADCHAYIGGRGRRSHYETSADLPDAFVLDQLRRLTPGRVDDSVRNAGVGLSLTMFPPTSLPPTW